MNAADLQIRGLRPADRTTLKRFTCSRGEPREDVVEEQIRGPLPGRYLDTPPYFDGRMLLGFDADGRLLVVGAHHIEPGLRQTSATPRSSPWRGTHAASLADLPDGEQISLGHLMMLVIFQQMRRLGRHSRTFVRVDRRNARRLALVDRVGLTEERSDRDRKLVQRWGELPRGE